MNQNRFGIEHDSGPERYADTNKDGQHSREEYPQKDLFDAVDANQDGQAKLDEMRAYYRSNAKHQITGCTMDSPPNEARHAQGI